MLFMLKNLCSHSLKLELVLNWICFLLTYLIKRWAKSREREGLKEKIIHGYVTSRNTGVKAVEEIVLSDGRKSVAKN